MSIKDIVIMIAVLFCMAVMGFLRTRRLMKESEKRGRDDTEGSTGRNG